MLAPPKIKKRETCIHSSFSFRSQWLQTRIKRFSLDLVWYGGKGVCTYIEKNWWSPPSVWRGRLPGVPLRSCALFLDIFFDHFLRSIFLDIGSILGGFWASNSHFFRYFSLSFFDLIFGSIFVGFLMEFWPLETLKIVTFFRKNVDFYQIDVFALSSKIDPKNVEIWIPQSKTNR